VPSLLTEQCSAPELSVCKNRTCCAIVLGLLATSGEEGKNGASKSSPWAPSEVEGASSRKRAEGTVSVVFSGTVAAGGGQRDPAWVISRASSLQEMGAAAADGIQSCVAAVDARSTAAAAAEPASSAQELPDLLFQMLSQSRSFLTPA
jgi:hypothetical protein